MGLVTSLVALAICGADPVPAAPAVAEPGSEITCQVEMMTVDGLGWRSAAYSRIKPASRQGSATIWTADRSIKGALEAMSNGKLVKAPKVTLANDAPGTINSDKTQDYIRHLDRISDGPINGASQVAFQPELATICEGFSVRFAGHRFDQGVMTKVKISESHVGSLHTLLLHEQVSSQPVPPPAAMTTSAIGRYLIQSLVAPTQTDCATTVQVPELFYSQVEGEWFVADDSILLVSLGVNTVADSEGKAKVQERLAILDFARPCDEERTIHANLTPTTGFEHDIKVAGASANLSMPTVPDRSFPEAVGQNGEVFDFPPLPEAYASNDLDQIKPGSPLASPQGLPTSRMMTDLQLARTSLQAIPDSEIEDPNALLQGYCSKLVAAARSDSELMKILTMSRSSIGLTELDSEFCPVEANGLSSVVEGFLRKGMGTSVAQLTCTKTDCPAEGCPFSAEGCDEAPPSTQANKVEMGISVKDGKGLCVYNAEEDLISALKYPGKAEVKYIPLGGDLSLEIQAKVVSRRSAYRPTHREQGR